jgi:carboxylate-amine ligase
LLARDLEPARPLGDLVAEEAARLDVPALVDLFDRESGATRQRRRRRDEGLDALCESLVLERE